SNAVFYNQRSTHIHNNWSVMYFTVLLIKVSLTFFNVIWRNGLTFILLKKRFNDSTMKKNFPVLLCFTMLFFLLACNKRSGKPRVLVFTKTAGFHHQSIPAGVSAIQKLGVQNDFEVDTTSDAN